MGNLFRRKTVLCLLILVCALGMRGSALCTQAAEDTNEALTREWHFTSYGNNASTTKTGYSGSIQEGNLNLWTDGAGKMVPNSTDGLALYYTKLDAETENFTLSGTLTINSWTLSNGMEGFGIIATDRVGAHGQGNAFWNNAYMGAVTRVSYYYDNTNNKVATSGTNYDMRQGVATIGKSGVTKELLPLYEVNDVATVRDYFHTQTTTLDTTAAGRAAGTYNIVGNATTTPSGTIAEYTTFQFELTRNNTGYIVTYTDELGKVTSQTYYHGDEGDELRKLDEDSIYAGFFVASSANITVSDVKLTTILPSEDAPAEEQPITYIPFKYSIESASIATSKDYEFVYYGNADGYITVKNDGGKVLAEGEVAANTKFRFDTILEPGNNTFKMTFVPDEDFKPSTYERLESYAPQNKTYTVNYSYSDRKFIFVHPEGSAKGIGSKTSPLDIYSAVKIAAPGQMIILMEGTYQLKDKITIQRGIDGTAECPIYMIADPDAKTRPVLDFGGVGKGIHFAGDYWYIQGFDVTNTVNRSSGLAVSGNYNVVDNVYAYRNGNTGITISRYKGTDTFEDWPHDNLVLNCTSYLNADEGYEDADGFGCKLTAGEGNVFDGCIAAYNADDGWDFFAKVETGNIGAATIRNSVAFKNGYVLDENGMEVNAGNGNGFKMGGESLSGYHVLINSFAFANKSKGIDSNSCPDISVYGAVSFDNERNNVAFYTGNAANTDFYAEGVISYKKSNTKGDTINVKGTQDTTKLYKTTNYYYNGSEAVNTRNKKVAASWFQNLDTDAAIHGGITRNADGTINMNGYLVLTDAAPADAGARMTGISSKCFVYVEPQGDDDVCIMPLKGLAQAADGKYYYYNDGVIDTTVSGLKEVKRAGSSNWLYFENGNWIQEKYGFVEYEGGRFLVADGAVADLDGLVLYDDVWYFLANGQLQNTYTGLAMYDGEWFYVKEGVLPTDYNGIQDYDGSQFLIAAGRVRFDFSGLFQNTDEKWYFLANGQVQNKYTGLAQYDGAWFYIEKGVLASAYSGEVWYDGAKFRVLNGKLI